MAERDLKSLLKFSSKLKSQSLEGNILQDPPLSSGKNINDVLGTFGDMGMWVAKKWPEKTTREQKREANK